MLSLIRGRREVVEFEECELTMAGSDASRGRGEPTTPPSWG
jgi:hypothetical protein